MGCGEWTPPKIPNPDFKGKWFAPKIDNPSYIGVWKPAQIPNPNFFLDEQPHAMTPIGGIGIELWTMQASAGLTWLVQGSPPRRAPTP